MRRGLIHAAAVVIGLVSGIDVPVMAADKVPAAPAAQITDPAPPPPTQPATLAPVRYADMPGWRRDDHASAFTAFLRSCDRLLATADQADPSSSLHASRAALIEVCRQARTRADERNAPRHGPGTLPRRQAQAFFEHFFLPHRVVRIGARGLLTGYYEPQLDGSRVQTARFRVPLYRRPPDLENVVAEAERGASGIAYSHMQRTPQGLVPYPTRTDIEAGALAGKGLELIWLTEPVEAFFLQIQGSGVIRFPDGSSVRVTYDGKNGHPYTSIGRYLIDQGVIGATSMTLDRLGAYLRADERRGREVMQQNASFVFFRELSPAEGERALGAMGIGLTAGRSLAVDASVHTLGTPIYVVAPTLRHAVPNRPFQRLMVAQDVGSAIRGPERGDIFFGSGERAGALAGVTKEPGQFFVLVPRSGISRAAAR